MFLGTIPSHFELPFVRHWNLSVGFLQSKLVILQRGCTHLYLKCLCQGYGPFGQNTLHIGNCPFWRITQTFFFSGFRQQHEMPSESHFSYLMQRRKRKDQCSCLLEHCFLHGDFFLTAFRFCLWIPLFCILCKFYFWF